MFTDHHAMIASHSGEAVSFNQRRFMLMIPLLVQALADATMILAEGIVLAVTLKKTWKFRNRQGASGPDLSALVVRDGKIHGRGTLWHQ